MINVQAIAPSGKISREKFELGKKNIEAHFDVNIQFSDCIFETKRGMAGKEEDRLNDFVNAFQNPDIDLVWAIRGGFGASRVLPLLPKQHLNSKLLIGYSDITAYQWYLYKIFGMQSLSGQMIQVDFDDMEKKKSDHQKLFDLIQNETIEWDMPNEVTRINFKTMSGKIIGGCLSVIEKLLGTNFLPDLSNHILFLEDVGEENYRLDGLFSHLKNAGLFEQISGLILGQFSKPKTVDEDKFNKELNQLYEEYFYDLNIPIIQNFPIGHIDRITPLPIGYNAIIEPDKLRFTR